MISALQQDPQELLEDGYIRAILDPEFLSRAEQAMGSHAAALRAGLAAVPERALNVDLGTFAARAELWAALSLSEPSAP